MDGQIQGKAHNIAWKRRGLNEHLVDEMIEANLAQCNDEYKPRQNLAPRKKHLPRTPVNDEASQKGEDDAPEPCKKRAKSVHENSASLPPAKKRSKTLEREARFTGTYPNFEEFGVDNDAGSGSGGAYEPDDGNLSEAQDSDGDYDDAISMDSLVTPSETEALGCLIDTDTQEEGKLPMNDNQYEPSDESLSMMLNSSDREESSAAGSDSEDDTDPRTLINAMFLQLDSADEHATGEIDPNLEALPSTNSTKRGNQEGDLPIDEKQTFNCICGEDIVEMSDLVRCNSCGIILHATMNAEMSSYSTVLATNAVFIRKTLCADNASASYGSDDVIACPCGDDDKDAHMIQCDNCREWQHTECAGLEVETAEHPDFRFFCLCCIKRGAAPPEFRIPSYPKVNKMPTSQEDDGPQTWTREEIFFLVNSKYEDPETFSRKFGLIGADMKEKKATLKAVMEATKKV
ncbi:hypothetical protein GQ53DRAFT_869764 [Thozetella sp. PMI_491]|nr:hypothetical protein GQ53DRAFT_869764 [Thozetella sp. PMI_491]